VSDRSASQEGRRSRRLWKYCRFCCITQNSVLHDVHSMKTVVATGNALVLLYLSEAEDVGVERPRRVRVDGWRLSSVELVGTGSDRFLVA